MMNAGSESALVRAVARHAIVACVVLLAGCGTVRSAREAQQRVAPVADASVPGAAAPDLKGKPLESLFAYALTNRPSMVSAALAVRDAHLAMKEIAADAPLVSDTPWNAFGLDASVRYSESSPARHFSDFETKTEKGTATGALSLDLLLWDFGRNAARSRAQAENVIAAERDFVREGYTVFEEVAAAYIALVKNDALLEVAETNVAMYADHLALAEDRFRLGEAMQLDVLRARLDLATAKESLVSASNDVETAGADLMAALGVPASSGDYATVLGPRPGGLDVTVRNFPDTVDGAAAAYAVGCTNAPSVAIARAKLRAASAQVDYAVANLLPSVSASVSLNWADPRWYWSWGVSVVESLFTGFRRTTAVDRAVVAMESAAANVASEELALSRSIELAVAERDNAREALAAARARVSQARENFDAVAARYAVGDASRIDFTDAMTDYAGALGNRATAFYRGQAAEARLFRLKGATPEFHEETRRENER